MTLHTTCSSEADVNFDQVPQSMNHGKELTVTTNPYAHLEGKKRENFFEAGAVTSYDRSESVAGWDDF